jgi:hypothetical protein
VRDTTPTAVEYLVCRPYCHCLKAFELIVSSLLVAAFAVESALNFTLLRLARYLSTISQHTNTDQLSVSKATLLQQL